MSQLQVYCYASILLMAFISVHYNPSLEFGEPTDPFEVIPDENHINPSTAEATLVQRTRTQRFLKII